MPQPTLKALVRSTILLGLIAGGVFGVEQLYDGSDVVELPSRCLQKSKAFIRDREFGAPQERREYTYRSHYNFVKHRCFAQTDSTITLPLDKKVQYVSQVWDVDARIGAPAYATKWRSMWLIPDTDELIGYADSPDRPRNMRGEEWFAGLMTQ